MTDVDSQALPAMTRAGPRAARPVHHRRATRGCLCTPRRRAWQDDGTCASCGQRVHEFQVLDVVRATLITDPACILYRNEIGASTHWPTGEKRKGPIRYGVANPGGADLIGLYRLHSGVGVFLAVETKTVNGRQNADQRQFQKFVEQRGGIYVICRSADDAGALLARLRAEVPR